MGVRGRVQYIRENFLKKYADNISSGLYDVRDLDRLKSDETFASSYIRGPDRLDEGVELVHSSFKFRKEMKVNDLHEDMLDQEQLELGQLYFHNKDNCRHRILWVKVKFHRKDSPAEKLAMEKLCLIYAVEKAFNASPLEKITFMLDMTSCGLANLDIDYVKFIITIFKFYYPTFLANMLIYDMPWIFNAAWKVIKTWLSAEAASLIKFVTKADIQGYINLVELPPYMGGTDTFEYTYKSGMATDPLFPDDDDMRKVHFQEAQDHSSNPPSPGASVSASSSDTDSPPFDHTARTPDSHRHRSPAAHIQQSSRSRPTSISDKKLSLMQVRSNSSSTASSHVGRLLTVSPADELIFHVRNSGEPSDVITLTNTLPSPVAFKVKTTSPEKFRVRPSSGLIKPEKTEEVYINLVQADQVDDLSKDKFLIMAIDVQGGSADLNQLFKDAPRDKIMQHKLKCSIGVHEDAPIKSKASHTVNQGGTDPVLAKVEKLETQIQHMQKQLNLLLALQLFIAFTLFIFIFSRFCIGEELLSYFVMLPFGFGHKGNESQLQNDSL